MDGLPMAGEEADQKTWLPGQEKRMMKIAHADFIACKQCAGHCFAAHHDTLSGSGDDMRSSVQHILLESRRRPQLVPSFVCVVSCDMLPGNHHSSHDPCMIFPRMFADRHLSKCVGKVSLEGPGGCSWLASLQIHRGSMALSSPGWAAFAEDHGLQEGDALMFTYIGQNCFKVRVFVRKEGYTEKGKDCRPSHAEFLHPFADTSKEKESDQIELHRRAVSKGKCSPSKFLCISSCSEKEEASNCGNEGVSNCPSKGNDQLYNDCSKSRGPTLENNADDQHSEQDACQSASCICTKFFCTCSEQEEDPAAQETPLERAKALHMSFAVNLSNPTITKIMTKSAVHSDFKLIFPMDFVRLHMPSKNKWITHL